jgi:hypothetical protein
MKQKVDLRQNATPLNKQEVLQALTNSRQHHTLVVPKTRIDERKIRQTKEILSELYPNASFASTSARDIYDIAVAQTRSLIEACRNFMNLGYPFNAAFEQIIETVSPIGKMTADTLFEEIPKLEDALLDTKEDLVEPLMEFMNGEKRKIYDSVVRFLKENQNNLRYIDDPSKEVLEKLVKLDKPYLGNHIPKAKQALERVSQLLAPLIEQARDEAIAKVEAVISELQSNESFKEIPEAERYKVIRPRQELIESLKATSSIDTIRQRTNEDALADELDRGLETIAELIDIPVVSQTVRLSKVAPKDKIALKTAEDVEAYVEKLKENLLKEIESGKQILLS